MAIKEFIVGPQNYFEGNYFSGDYTVSNVSKSRLECDIDNIKGGIVITGEYYADNYIDGTYFHANQIKFELAADVMVVQEAQVGLGSYFAEGYYQNGYYEQRGSQFALTAELTRYGAVLEAEALLATQFAQDQSYTRIRDFDLEQITEFTSTITVGKIVQGECAFDALFAPSMTALVIKNTFAVLDSTSALAVVAIANRSADIALSSIVNQSLQGDRLRDYAVDITSNVTQSVSYATNKQFDSTQNAEFTQSVNNLRVRYNQAQLLNAFSPSLTVSVIKNNEIVLSSQFSQVSNAVKTVKISKTINAAFNGTILGTKLKPLASSINAVSTLTGTVRRYAYRPNNATSTTFVTSTKATNSFTVSSFNGYSNWKYLRSFVKPTVATSDMSQRLMTFGNQFYVDRIRTSGTDYIKVNGSDNFAWSGQLANQDYELRAEKRASPSSDIIDVYFNNVKAGEVDLYYQTYVPPTEITNGVTWSGTFSGATLSAYASGNSSQALDADLQSLGAVPCWLYWDGTYLHFHTTIGADNGNGYTVWRNVHQRWLGLGIVSGSNYTISMQMTNSATYSGALLTLNGVYKSWGGVVSNGIIGSLPSGTLTSYYISNHTGGPIGASSGGTYVTTDNRTYSGTLNATYSSTYPVEYDELLIARDGYLSELAVTPTANTDDEWKFNSQNKVLGLYHFDNNGLDDTGSDVFEVVTESVISSVSVTPKKLVQTSVNLNANFGTQIDPNRIRATNSNISSQFNKDFNVTKVVFVQANNNAQFNGVFDLRRIRRSTSNPTANVAIDAVPYDFAKSGVTCEVVSQLTTTANRIRPFETQFDSIFSDLTAATKIGVGLIGFDVNVTADISVIKTTSTSANMQSTFVQSTFAVKTTRTSSDQQVTTDFVIDYDRIKESKIPLNAVISSNIINSRTRGLEFNNTVTANLQSNAIKTAVGTLDIDVTALAVTNNLRVRYNSSSQSLTTQQTSIVRKIVNPPTYFESIAIELVVANKIAFDAALQLAIPSEYRTILVPEEDTLLMVPEETRVNMVRKIAI